MTLWPLVLLPTECRIVGKRKRNLTVTREISMPILFGNGFFDHPYDSQACLSSAHLNGKQQEVLHLLAREAYAFLKTACKYLQGMRS